MVLLILEERSISRPHNAPEYVAGRYGVLPYQRILRIKSRRGSDARMRPGNQWEFTLQRVRPTQRETS